MAAKKPGKNNHDNIEDAVVVSETENESNILEFGELMNIVLDYYSATGEQPLEDGDEWKKGTDYQPKGINIPSELDIEVKKAFITQIRKFQ